MGIQDVIAARRDGKRHSEADLHWLAEAAARGDVPDYQLAAWLMAAYLNPLDPDETAWLTKGMADSGQRLDLTGLPHPWLDKHSTGGVGDKTSLVVLPMLAACGVTMVKMSGRGLGITGGTVDKLESVPGFRMDLSPREMIDQAGRIGLAISGQTADLAPADKVMYALRDAVCAVASTPLIVSSILSKKLAGGAEFVSLDVKCGSGGFMQDLDAATELAKQLASTAERCGLKTHVEITDMSQPLGRTVGNAIEVREAIATLKGAPGRFRDLCLLLVSGTLEACGKALRGDGRKTALDALDEGKALAKAREWFAAQGASGDVFDDPAQLPLAPIAFEAHAQAPGWIERIDAGTVGRAAIDLGAGRHKKEDAVDPTVGFEIFVEVGDKVERGQPLIKVYARSKAQAEAALAAATEGVRISESPWPRTPLALTELPK